MAVTRLTLIRHGETAWNQGGRIQGHMDIPLNARGQEQAERMAVALDGSDMVTIYSSDLSRAWQTAQALHNQIGAPLLADQGLRERCFGVLQGQTLAEMFAKNPHLATAFQTRDPHYQPPEGESMVVFRKRVLETVYRLAQRHCGQHIAVVAHGGVLDMLYRDAVGLDLQTQRSWVIDNTSVHRLLWTSQGLQLLAWGDVTHLDGMSTVEVKQGSVASEDVMKKHYL
ncbi:histidine phosphatase family protein [Lampropedia puyangensis]|uniref:Histidine phosphatase family protein n=1 Tax=Lampropedia puyangensis TaxID=1330072 RepID=A0A4S8F986_9BURK|nr:histidine phosphatase family protein [Lampropedia puyangensis]THU03807.1 histidine phosphatase family protein [Lampropedia puyangensis]